MELDCQTCGACCHLYDVLLDAADEEHFERRPRLIALTYIHRLGNGHELRFLRRDARTDACVAFAGPLEANRCTIYADRPHLCRAFEVGSPDCLAAREKLAAIRARRSGAKAPGTT